jgi:type IV pilus biogenesis protein CpaD/CtpE
MKNIPHTLLFLALTAGLTLNGLAQTPPAAAAALPDPGITRSAIDLIRSDLKAEKAVVIAQNLLLTDAESAEFWPLYNDYNAALGKLLDDRLEILKEYVATCNSMTDAQASALARRVFDLEAKRTELKRVWFRNFSDVVPARKAAQFFQIENQINAALDLLLMDSLPLIK